MNDFAVVSETVCLWLVVHSYDRAIKTLCCLKLISDFNYVNIYATYVINFLIPFLFEFCTLLEPCYVRSCSCFI